MDPNETISDAEAYGAVADADIGPDPGEGDPGFLDIPELDVDKVREDAGVTGSSLPPPPPTLSGETYNASATGPVTVVASVPIAQEDPEVPEPPEAGKPGLVELVQVDPSLRSRISASVAIVGIICVSLVVGGLILADTILKMADKVGVSSLNDTIMSLYVQGIISIAAGAIGYVAGKATKTGSS